MKWAISGCSVKLVKMRYLRFISFALLTMALLAVMVLWVATRTTAEYIAVSTDYRGPAGDWVSGFRTFGIYASHGDVGWVYYSDLHGLGMLEPGEPIRPVEPTRFIWRPDCEFFIPRSELNYHLKYARFGIS